jgi:hypothetical protein
MKRITLCVIARDEEAMLPACLASVAGAVDAMVVVDTGSSDGTVRLAAAAGARVVHHVWADDFAAARNAALAEVREDGFILSLDADERLAPGAGAALRSAVAQDELDCGLLPLLDAETLDASPAEILAGSARRGEPVLLPRLLRRTPDLHWEGIVHEQVATWLARPGRRSARVDAPLLHYGAVPDLRAARRKDERNYHLLVKRCALEPENAVARSYLAREHVRRGEESEARAALDAAWALVLAAPAESCDVVLTATLRTFLLLVDGRLDEAGATLDAAESRTSEHPNLHLLRGVLCERRLLMTDGAERAALLADAERAFRGALALHGQAFTSELLPGATSWAAGTRLGTVLLLGGRPSEARQVFEGLLATRPGLMEASLGAVEALVDSGDLAAAVRAVEPLLRTDTADAWLLAAAAVEGLNQMDDVRLFVAQARARLAKSPLIAEHRMRRLYRLERAANMQRRVTDPIHAD